MNFRDNLLKALNEIKPGFILIATSIETNSLFYYVADQTLYVSIFICNDKIRINRFTKNNIKRTELDLTDPNSLDILYKIVRRWRI